MPRAPIVLGIGVLAVLVLTLATRPAAPARPATHARAEQLRQEKRGPTPRVEVADPRGSPSAPASSTGEGLAGVVGACLLASMALGSIALVVERRGRRDSTEDGATESGGLRGVLLRLGYSGAGACFGVAISLAIVFAVARPRPDEPRPRATPLSTRPSSFAETLTRPAHSPVTVPPDRPGDAVAGTTVRQTESALRDARRADDRPRGVPVAQARPASREAVPRSVPPVAAVAKTSPSVGAARSEPEVSASPALPAPGPPTSSVEMSKAETASPETTEASKTEPARAETPKSETPRLDTARVEVSRAGAETARRDLAARQTPRAQAPERPLTPSAEPDQNLVDKIRDDWKTIKGQAKSDVDGIVRTLRHWLRRD
jgi:hypothetical protein